VVTLGADPAARDNDDMVRAANLTARAIVLAGAGALTFLARQPDTAILAAKIAAFALSAVFIVGWELTGVRARRAPLLPYALGFVIVACGVLGSGNWLIGLSCVAAAMAGSELGVAAGWVTAGLGMIGTAVTALAVNTVATAAGDTVLLLVFFLIGLSRRDHRIQAEQAAAMLAQADRLRDEQARAATLDERNRIGREIHDVLAHSLGALGLHIQLVRAVLTDQHDEARAIELLDQAHRMATDGLAETRRAVHALHGETPWLPDGLTELGAEHQRRYGARVSVAITGEPHPLPPDAGLAIARTAQEALVNTAKHAPHQPVEVRLDYGGSSTSLTVSNHLAENGSGAPPPGLATVNGGYGLAGMRERLLLLGGSLSAGRSGSDWIVVAEVPR
jgi:signal transduction histidine kinase